MSKLIKPLFLVLGLALFAWVMWQVDMASVTHLVLAMGPGFVVVISIFGLVSWCDALSWKYALKPEETRGIRAWEIWRIRTIGESFNAITPFGTLGGEPVKAQLLKDQHGLSFKQGLASQVVARTTILIALILFMIPGTFLLGGAENVPANFKTVGLVGLAVFSILILLFLAFQVTGSLGKIVSGMTSFLGDRAPRTFLNQLTALDQMMSAYYRQHPRHFMLSVLFGFLGWMMELTELYWVLYFLGKPLGWMDIWIIEALVQGIRVGSFFIPLNLGALEGGLVIIFKSMGLGADYGLAVSLVRRIRELTWVALGLILGWAIAFKPSRIAVESAEES